MAKAIQETLYCVKVQIWENGLLKKILSKDFFRKEDDAIRFYNGCEEEGTVVELSKYTDGYERSIKAKTN